MVKKVARKPRPDEISLFDRRWVDKRFYDMVYQAVGDVEWTEDFDPAVTAADLCGRDFWNSFSPLQRQLIGMCISHHAYVGDLPLVKVNPKGKTPNKYKHRSLVPSSRLGQ
jgi:hypothetical protein